MQVSVFNTVGSNESVIEFNGTTWADLQSVLRENSISYRDMSAIIGETQVTLESPQAQTPTTDFSLFLLPVEVKSGFEDDVSFDDNMEDDGNFSDGDFSDDDNVKSQGILSPDTLNKIKKLEEAKSAIDSIIVDLKKQLITDPRILALHAKAAQLAANRKS